MIQLERFLDLLIKFDFEAEPMIINFDAELTPRDIAAIEVKKSIQLVLNLNFRTNSRP